MNIAMIFAGGSGKRMNTVSKPKQFLELRGKPIIIYTLELFDLHEEIDGIVVVCLEAWIPYLKKMLKKFEITKVVEVVPGGATGQDSIYNGLECVARHYPDDSTVLIHDGVRPLVSREVIGKCFEEARRKKAVVPVVPVVESLRHVSDGAVPRADYRLVQTPQTFDIQLLKQAYRLPFSKDFTDDASVVEAFGHPITMVEGNRENIKLTTPFDLRIAETLL